MYMNTVTIGEKIKVEITESRENALKVELLIKRVDKKAKIDISNDVIK